MLILIFLDNKEDIKKVFIIMDSILGVIGIMSLFILTLGLVNTLIMSIYEKTKEIGILKSIGARNSEVRKLFIIESGIIGLLGALFGFPLRWRFTRLTNFISFSMLFEIWGRRLIYFPFLGI